MTDTRAGGAHELDAATINRNRAVLLLIAGIPVIVILAASWLWYFVVRGDLDLVGTLGTANNGNLLRPPRAAAALELRYQAGGRFDLAAGAPKWTLLVPVAGAVCDEACERRLYLTRQIHVAMGKAFNRLQRAFVGEQLVADTALAVATLSDGRPAPASFRDYLQREQVGLLTLRAGGAALDDTFPELAGAPDSWYLVDPAGWIMMAYDDSVDYKDVMADLKFLLKNSNG
jgi:hypothetical protein